MADFNPTGCQPASANTRDETIQLGENISAPKWVVKNPLDSKAYIADCLDPLLCEVYGILYVGGSSGAYGKVVKSGPVIFSGDSDTGGKSLFLSENGLAMPEGDQASGDIVSYLGGFTSTVVFDVNVKNYGNIVA